MRKHQRKWLGIMSALVLAISGTVPAVAANQYDAAVETVSGKVLFPGDSLLSVEPVLIGPGGEYANVMDGRYTNDTAKVYQVLVNEGEAGGVWLDELGSTVSVKNGKTSLETGEDHHYTPQNPEEGGPDKADIAWYGAMEWVSLEAEETKDGLAFDHWEVKRGNVTLEDDHQAKTHLTMPEEAVEIEAVYAAS